MVKLMNQRDKEILNYLVEAVSSSFLHSKKDRSGIHSYEWEEADVNSSVLMEVELKKTDIVATSTNLSPFLYGQHLFQQRSDYKQQ